MSVFLEKPLNVGEVLQQFQKRVPSFQWSHADLEKEMLHMLKNLSRLEASAHKLEKQSEVPIAATLLGPEGFRHSAFNQEMQKPWIAEHAECCVIREAQKNLGKRYLSEYLILVSLEPCLLCWGAILQARVGALIFAAYSPKFGAVCSLYHLGLQNLTNHRPLWAGGFFEDESAEILKNYFFKKR